MVIRGAEYPKQQGSHFPTPREPIASLFNTFQFRKYSLCDPCCGTGAMINVFREFGYNANGFDINPWAPYSYGDFLKDDFPNWYKQCDIVCNPPYGTQGRQAIQFIARALEVTNEWQGKVAMLLPMDFDSAKTRRHWFADNPAFFSKLVLLNRIKWFDGQGGSVNHAWFIWDWRNNKLPIIRYAE